MSEEDGRVVEDSPKTYWYGTEYKPLYPGREFKECIAGDWTEDITKMIKYYDTCSIEFLIEEANLAFWPDDTVPMIRSLYKREPERAVELARDIIDKKKGEDFMQEEAKAFLISKNAWKAE